MQLRYRFRLHPTHDQQVALAKAFGCARVVFNDALAARKAAYEAGQGWVSGAVLSKRLITQAKQRPDRAFLADVSAVVLQQALRDNDTAYRNFFNSIAGKRKGPKVAPPGFRSKRDSRQSIRFTVNGKQRITPDGKLRLPRVGDIKVKWSRVLPSVPSSVTVVKDASGRYFASFVVTTDSIKDFDRFPMSDVEAGIDLGLTSFAVLSDGTVVDNPRFLRKAERRLKKAQQALSRKQKGSNNRAKARVKVAKTYTRIADSRRDFHHKLSTTLIRENQAVYVEDLNVAALARTRMAKSVHDAGWSSFVRMLEYKATRYGRTFAKVDRWAPTSQVCSACGVKDGKKPLDVREWTCAACGAHHDRDVNAARNILSLGQAVAAGRAETVNACGGDVRPRHAVADPDEAGTRRDDRALAGVTW